MRIMLRFTKTSDLRWISHLDTMRTLEKALRRAGGEDPRGARPRYIQRAARPFPAAHRQNYAFSFDFAQSQPRRNQSYNFAARQRQNRRVEYVFYFFFMYPPYKPGRVFRAGQILAEYMNTKARVYALIQNPAEYTIPFDNQNIVDPLPFCFERGGQSGGSAAYYYQIFF